MKLESMKHFYNNVTLKAHCNTIGWIGRWPFRGPAISTLASQRFALAADVGKLISPLCLFTEQVR